MKLDLKSWLKVEKPHVWNIAPKGRLQLRLSQPAPLYVQGIDPETGEVLEVLAGFGATFDLRTDIQELSFKTQKDIDVYVYDPKREVLVFDDTVEVFTNVDKMPLESEHVIAVQAAMRQMQLQQAMFMREMKIERAALLRAKQAAAAPSAESPADPPASEAPAAE